MVAVVRLVAVMEVEEIGVCEGITIAVVDQEMAVMENKCLLYEKRRFVAYSAFLWLKITPLHKQEKSALHFSV
ncbi:hypothetical protein LOK49_LG08G01822 [Camellia lanceoleosa]|uniref:Uncharacterized protein n=1 Tax=Camellia lanceoleosa TaxID=1840588 RepID=A0ACC0GYB1_9ERIC|nr:hypothetical protein LOK49_LG08G01822 [Camellia lanceoleosa]